MVARKMSMTRNSLIRRVSTVVVQRFCKPLVGGSNPSPGTDPSAVALPLKVSRSGTT